MDLWEAFDTISHELLITKLHVYGFDKSSLKILWSYLANCWQRTKIGTAFSSWTEIIKEVPQGSVLRPIFFNKFLNDRFFLLKDIGNCSHADDTTPYACDQNLDQLINRLEQESLLSVSWFDSN